MAFSSVSGHGEDGVTLFTVTVALRADAGTHVDPESDSETGVGRVGIELDDAPGPEEIIEMARAAMEAVWFDIWNADDRPFRGQQAIVTAQLADGSIVDDIAK